MAVLSMEQPPALQFRHQQVDDIVHPLGKHIDHHRKAVGRLRLQPFLHGVCDHVRSAHDVMMSAWRAREKLTDRKVFGDRKLDDALAPANPVLEFLIRGKLIVWERSIQMVAEDADADAGTSRQRPVPPLNPVRPNRWWIHRV